MRTYHYRLNSRALRVIVWTLLGGLGLLTLIVLCARALLTP